MLANDVGARRLVDADRPDRPVRLLHQIATDPADVCRELLLAGAPRARRGLLDFFVRLPARTAHDHVVVHRSSFARLPSTIVDTMCSASSPTPRSRADLRLCSQCTPRK